MSRVNVTCPYYCGDEDCQKCGKYGYIFSCAGCEYNEDDVKDPYDAVKREAVLNTLDTMDKALDENRLRREDGRRER